MGPLIELFVCTSYDVTESHPMRLLSLGLCFSGGTPMIWDMEGAKSQYTFGELEEDGSERSKIYIIAS